MNSYKIKKGLKQYNFLYAGEPIDKSEMSFKKVKDII